MLVVMPGQALPVEFLSAKPGTPGRGCTATPCSALYKLVRVFRTFARKRLAHISYCASDLASAPRDVLIKWIVNLQLKGTDFASRS